VDRTVFIPTAALGIVLVLIYCARCWKAGVAFNVGTLISLVLHSAGIVAGCIITLSTVYEPLRDAVSELNVYILISGLAVVAVSAQAVAGHLQFGAPEVKRPPAREVGMESRGSEEPTPNVGGGVA